jgi:hypothetical protein
MNLMDEIVDEVRATREVYAARFNYRRNLRPIRRLRIEEGPFLLSEARSVMRCCFTLGVAARTVPTTAPAPPPASYRHAAAPLPRNRPPLA